MSKVEHRLDELIENVGFAKIWIGLGTSEFNCWFDEVLEDERLKIKRAYCYHFL